MEESDTGSYHSTISQGYTDSQFYHYQINRAVNMAVRTYGSLPLPREHLRQQQGFHVIFRIC